MAERAPLTVPRIVSAAVTLADRDGLAALTMRGLGRELGVEGMALYHHLSGKDALLDALADWVADQVRLPDEDLPWKRALREHAISLRAVLIAHPWALSLVDSRTSPGAPTLRRNDAVIGCFRRGGFTTVQISHAFSLLDAYVYGFALTERNLPFDPATGAMEFADEMDVPWDEHPHLGSFVSDMLADGDYAYSAEFEIGLDMLLDAAERMLGPGR